jgi:H+-transporting ATPase
MLLLNAVIGFHEEMKALSSLEALRGDLKQTVNCRRDGRAEALEVALLVPGDIVLLKGGMVVPADCMWVEGDTVAVDTAPLTGEPIPRKVPRPDAPESPGSGKELLAGCTVMNGECYARVELTGADTEIGAAAAMVQESSGAETPVFERKVMVVVKIVIVVALAVAIIMFLVQYFSRGVHVRDALLASLAMRECLPLLPLPPSLSLLLTPITPPLSLLPLLPLLPLYPDPVSSSSSVIGSVPIALPLVIMVTMAIGSKKMAEHKALVTHVSALQDIASMTVLNSDKTGTLTTARISIIRKHIYSHTGFTDDDVFRLAVVSANRDNRDDAIDGAICRSWDAEHGGTEDSGIAAVGDGWAVSKMVGFNNAAKRTCCYATDPATGQSILIGKGLVTKILRCEPTAGQPDDEEDTHPQV